MIIMLIALTTMLENIGWVFHLFFLGSLGLIWSLLKLFFLLYLFVAS